MRWLAPAVLCCAVLMVPQAEARKPSKQEIADCQSQDAATAVKACTSIIDNPATKQDADWWAVYNRGHAYLKLDQRDKALADYDLCVAAGEKNKKLPFSRGQILLERGRTYLMLQQWAKAEADLSKAREEMATDVEPNILHGIALNQLERYDEAEDHLRWATMIGETDPRAFDQYGQALSGLGKYEEAAEAFSKSLALKFEPWVLGYRAFNYFKMGKLQEALVDAEAYATQNPNEHWSFQFRARLRALSGDLKAAQAYIDVALKAKPDDAYVNYVQGLIWQKGGEAEKAKTAFEKAISLDANAVEAYIGLGELALQNSPQQAIDWAKKAQAVTGKAKYAEDQRARGKALEEQALAVIEKPKRLLATCEEKKDKPSLAACTEFLGLKPAPVDELKARKARLALTFDSKMIVEDATAVLAADPTDHETRLKRGRALISTDERAKALADYDQVIAENPRHVRALTNRAMAHMGDKQFDLALADAQAALKLDPVDQPALFVATQVMIERKDWQAADAFASTAVAAHGDFPAPWRTRAQIRLDMGKPKEAIDDATRAILINKLDAESYGIRAAAYAKAGDDHNAIIDLSWLIEGRAMGNRRNEALLRTDRAAAYARTKQFALAAGDAAKAIELDPTLTAAKIILARSLAETGEHGKALALASDVLAIDPGNEQMHLVRAMAIMPSKDWDRLIAAAEQGLKANPRSTALLLMRAGGYFEKGMMAEALVDSDAALALNPQDAGLHANRANILDRMGRHADSLAAADAALAIVPDVPVLLMHKAKQQLALGKHAAALESLELALKREPGSPQALKLMGDTYSAIGSKDLALQNYAKALEAHAVSADDETWQKAAKEARAKLIGG